MKLALRPRDAIRALKIIDRKRPASPRKDALVGLTATADGLTFETNGSSAFVVAQVAVAGSCRVGRDALRRVLKTYPLDVPVTLDVVGSSLRIGRFRMPVDSAFRSRANAGNQT